MELILVETWLHEIFKEAVIMEYLDFVAIINSILIQPLIVTLDGKTDMKIFLKLIGTF